MSEDVATLILSRIEKLESRLQERIDRLALQQATEASRRERDEFSDIDPERFYAVTELVKIPGRPVSKQSLYAAMDSGALSEHRTGGPRGCLGRAYIAWLKARRLRRRGRPVKMKVGAAG